MMTPRVFEKDGSKITLQRGDIEHAANNLLSDGWREVEAERTNLVEFSPPDRFFNVYQDGSLCGPYSTREDAVSCTSEGTSYLGITEITTINGSTAMTRLNPNLVNGLMSLIAAVCFAVMTVKALACWGIQ